MGFHLTKSEILQDLNWLLTTPSILQSDWTVSDEQIASSIQTPFDRIEPFRLNTYRMGLYFEYVVQQWLLNDTRYELFQKNIQVQEGNQTIGELDILLFDRLKSEYEHWELTLKFYLCIEPEKGVYGCIGKTRADNFGDKIMRLREKQLKLCEFGATQQYLNSINVKVASSYALFKGILFYHISLGTFTHKDLNPYHIKGWWMYLSEFKKAFKDDRFVIRNKPNQMGLNVSKAAVLTKSEVTQYIENEGRQFEMIMLSVVQLTFGGTNEQSRGVVVADNWLG